MIDLFPLVLLHAGRAREKHFISDRTSQKLSGEAKLFPTYR
jgi:hypothetical protein